MNTVTKILCLIGGATLIIITSPLGTWFLPHQCDIRIPVSSVATPLDSATAIINHPISAFIVAAAAHLLITGILICISFLNAIGVLLVAGAFMPDRFSACVRAWALQHNE